MAGKAQNLELSAAATCVLAWILCVVPLAGQSPGRMETPAASAVAFRSKAATASMAGQPGSAVPETVDALLGQMSVSAGVIFAGQVTSVRKPSGFAGSGQDAAAGIVEIDLRVDQSARGPAAGSIYTLREWAGLWAGSSDRYKVGQRLLLFLYPAGANGLSAPVHGTEGAIPLRGSGIAPGPDDATSSAAEWLVDLRWLQAQALRRNTIALLPVRSPVDPTSEPSGSGPTSEDADPSLVRAIREPWLQPSPAAAETQPLSQVLALCHEAIALDAMRHRDAVR